MSFFTTFEETTDWKQFLRYSFKIFNTHARMDSMDISTDVTVMENLLAQKGLSGPERPKTSGERTTLEL